MSHGRVHLVIRRNKNLSEKVSNITDINSRNSATKQETLILGLLWFEEVTSKIANDNKINKNS